MIENGMRPVHPGEILREDFLKPMALSVNALAKHLYVPASRLNAIVLERRGVTADTALRLSRALGGDAQSWLNLQTAYDLRSAELNGTLQAEVEAIRPLHLLSIELAQVCWVPPVEDAHASPVADPPASRA